MGRRALPVPLLLQSTVIGKSRDRRRRESVLRVSGNTSAYRGRLFVLIDQRTGSSAEIFAAAIQESGRGTLVGRQSSGAVFGAEDDTLPEGFKVPLTLKALRENLDTDLDRVQELLMQTSRNP
jgi:carboxyl-terminal processing protease